MTPVTLTKIYTYQKIDKRDETNVIIKNHYVDCTIDAGSVESIQQFMDSNTGGFDSNITEVHMQSGEILYVKGTYSSVKAIINPPT